MSETVHVKSYQQEDLVALMELSEEERHDLLLLAAGMNIARTLAAKEAPTNDHG